MELNGRSKEVSFLLYAFSTTSRKGRDHYYSQFFPGLSSSASVVEAPQLTGLQNRNSPEV